MTTQLVSPYAASKIVNKWLEEDGVQKKLPPQMFYQYTSAKKAYIKVTLNEEGKRCVDEADLRDWYETKYMRRATKVDEVDENQLMIDFDTEEA